MTLSAGRPREAKPAAPRKPSDKPPCRKDDGMVTRKEFLVQVVQVDSGRVVLTLGGCGGGGG